MLIGYARISTTDQNLDLQHDALRGAGCQKIFDDRASGARADRPGLARVFDHLRTGDTLVVWRLDRLGRSLKDLIAQVEDLKAQGVGLKSLEESIDTTHPNGELILHLFGSLAQFERTLIKERTRAGLAAARARGRMGGRRKRLNAAKRAHAVALWRGREHTVREICTLMGIGRSTLYDYIRESTHGG